MAGAVASQLPTLLSGLQLAASVGQLNQSKVQHDDSVSKSVGMHGEQLHAALDLHREAIDNNTVYHNESIELDKRLHKKSVELERHGWDRQHVQWGKDRYLARKQAEREEMRDDWDQKNRRLDTAFLSATLVFSMLIAIICEGLPPTLNDDDGDADTWSERAEAIGLNGYLFSLWAFFMASALASVLLAMIFIWRAMSRMSLFLSELNKLENQWWRIKYRDVNNGSSSEAELAYLESCKETWDKQFSEADLDHNEVLSEGELKALLDTDGFEFHTTTLHELFNTFAEDGMDAGGGRGMTRRGWLKCRERIMARSMDTSYPERMRMYWWIKVRAVYSASVITLGLSLLFTLAVISITVYSRLAVLADNKAAGAVFLVCVFGLILTGTFGFELWLRKYERRASDYTQQRSKISKPDPVLLADPLRPSDAQRRWDEYEFTRQFIRGKLRKDTEEVVQELERTKDQDAPNRNDADEVLVEPTRTASNNRNSQRRFAAMPESIVTVVVPQPITNLPGVNSLILRMPAAKNFVTGTSAAYDAVCAVDPQLHQKAVVQLRSSRASGVPQVGQVIVIERPDNLQFKVIVLVIVAEPDSPASVDVISAALEKALFELGKREGWGGRWGDIGISVAVDLVGPHDPAEAVQTVYRICKEDSHGPPRIALWSHDRTTHERFTQAETEYHEQTAAWSHFGNAARRREARRRREQYRHSAMFMVDNLPPVDEVDTPASRGDSQFDFAMPAASPSVGGRPIGQPDAADSESGGDTTSLSISTPAPAINGVADLSAAGAVTLPQPSISGRWRRGPRGGSRAHQSSGGARHASSAL